MGQLVQHCLLVPKKIKDAHFIYLWGSEAGHYPALVVKDISMGKDPLEYFAAWHLYSKNTHSICIQVKDTSCNISASKD